MEASAPPPFVARLDDGGIVTGDDLDALLEVRADGVWPPGAEHDPWRQAPLVDGEVFVHEGLRCRFHAGDTPRPTLRSAVSLDSPAVELALSEAGQGWRLQVVDGDASVELAAEYVRVAVPYVEARQRDMPPGGWFEVDAAHLRWQQLGGSTGSRRERIAQDRSRLVRALAREGVAQAARLFETRRAGAEWVTRVTVPGDRLFLD